jgi:hypothetical protein
MLPRAIHFNVRDCMSSPSTNLPDAFLLLPEREHIRLGAGLEERDLQRSLADCVVLAHEL